MTGLAIVIGNKNYSSWSLRAWLFLKHTGAPFREIRIGLDEPDTRARILAHSPTGRVPALIDGSLTIWDSLAICEYLAEKFPEARGWPDDRAARATARSVSAEMHSGFQALRNELPMNIRAQRRVEPGAAARADIARVISIWEDSRARHGKDGPWLFGRFSIADAMYAPVAFRFETYGVAVGGAAAAWATALRNHPAALEWAAAGRAETETVPSDEAGTPV
jgi:glutathione S-transferase